MKVIERLLELQELDMSPTAGSPETQKAVEKMRKEIPDPIMGHYDRLRVRGKKGVVMVRRGVCMGCQMKLASGMYAKLVRDDDIAMCDNCARYLILAPEVAPATPPKPAAEEAPKRRRRKAVAADAAS